MPPRSRSTDDTAVRVGPAGAVKLGALEGLVADAMNAASLMVAAGATPATVTIYRRSLRALSDRLDNVTEAEISTYLERFMRGHVTTGEHNVGRAAVRCTARLVTLDRFANVPKEPTP